MRERAHVFTTVDYGPVPGNVAWRNLASGPGGHVHRAVLAGLDVDESRLDSVLQRTSGVTASFLKELLRRAALIAADEDPGTGAAGTPPLTVSADQLDAALDELLDTRNAMTRVLLGARPHARHRTSPPVHSRPGSPRRSRVCGLATPPECPRPDESAGAAWSVLVRTRAALTSARDSLAGGGGLCWSVRSEDRPPAGSGADRREGT